MAVRSTILAGPIFIDPLTAANFVPAAGTTWVVRTTVLANASAAATPFDIFLDNELTTRLIVTGLTVPANGRRIFEEWWALPAGHAFIVRNKSTTQGFVVTFFGAELLGVA